MSLTARHKKPGGFRKLVNSLETTPLEKRTKILDAMRREDPDFVGEVENCIFDFDEFKTIPALVMTEITSSLRTEPRILALALYHCKDQALLENFTKNMLPKDAIAFRDCTEELKEVKAYEQISARFRVITKARELEAQRKFTLKKYSTHYLDES